MTEVRIPYNVISKPCYFAQNSYIILFEQTSDSTQVGLTNVIQYKRHTVQTSYSTNVIQYKRRTSTNVRQYKRRNMSGFTQIYFSL